MTQQTVTLSNEEKVAHQASTQAVAQTARFMRTVATSESTNQGLAVYDNIGEDTYPQILQDMFDSMKADENVKRAIIGAVNVGRAQYRERSGGLEPTDSMIAFGLSAGAALHARDKDTGRNAFDGVEWEKFDNFNVDHHEAISLVPAMTVVTIATAIANSLPIVAMLPNPIGSNEVPLLYGRMTAGRTMGGFAAGEFLDGEKATVGYLENRWRYTMPNTTGNTYVVTPRVHYSDWAAKTPDAGSAAAPFQGGRVSIRVNGVEVANDRSRANTKKSGTTAMTPIQGVEIGGTAVLVTSGTANLDTGVITAVFAAPLPVGAVVTAHVIFDYERKDAEGKLILSPPSVDMAVEYASVLASAARAVIEASIDAITQLANELNVPFMAAALALIQNKYYLEQTVRLLDEGRERAENNGRTAEFDMSRGATGGIAAGFNTTDGLMGEIRKTLSLATLKINQTTGVGASTFDLFVSDVGAVLITNMNDDKFDRANTSFATHTNIVRLGSLKDGTNVYHVPTSSGLLTDAADNTTTEMLLVARSTEAAKSTFVGHMPVPPMVLTANPDPFVSVIGVYSRIAAELNPISRFGDQVCLISVINIPPL